MQYITSTTYKVRTGSIPSSSFLSAAPTLGHNHAESVNLTVVLNRPQLTDKSITDDWGSVVLCTGKIPAKEIQI